MGARLEGKVAFISGGARGQGRSHAVRLAEEGADIITFDICQDVESNPYPGPRAEDLAETVRQVESLDRRIIARQADVRDFAAVKAVADDGFAEFGRLDIVSGNAGILGEVNQLADQSEDGWQEMIDINLTGVRHTVKAALPHLRAGGNGGAIVLTSSTAGIKGYANMAHYVAAKHGVVGLMKTLVLELGKENIRVNTIHPTQVDTDMIQNEAIYKLFVPGKDNPSREDFAEVSRTMQALDIDWVEARDISNALLFLASDEARYITGQQLKVDAGQTSL
ncbi:mycofactocin-coupled SDR family oxidoreductase [Citricoccus sp. K5]|uniref:mycofactocin-coupled SDR family oxidoreductase n=1 Tax=Citricoccus sp. K5 TaxID=2653135 RepID=UPI0012EF1C3C|nr:mycofactocin-coupled SDR family oxidoreductase [Citricoccus sp. K5]VXB30062.1 Putative short-chain type dehydrogenase/reductase MSMEG_6031/MSMEI_5872 [Citricoccus sp. K5]